MNGPAAPVNSEIVTGKVFEMPEAPNFPTWSHAYYDARLALETPPGTLDGDPRFDAFLRYCGAAVQKALDTDGRVGYEHRTPAQDLIIDIRERLGEVTTEQALALKIGNSALQVKTPRWRRRKK